MNKAFDDTLSLNHSDDSESSNNLVTNTHEPADHLSKQEETINLRAKFPLAHRSIFARASKWIMAFIALIIFLHMVRVVIEGPSTGSYSNYNPILSLEVYDYFTYYIFYFSLLLLSLKLLYEEFFHMTYYYGIEEEHFVITTGVFLKNRSSLHISLITDILLTRSVSELCFLLYTIQVANPSPEAPLKDKISSLSRHNAIGLQDILVTMIKETRTGPETTNKVI